jgi:LmbE family N-acetylglucosaminyl deacetylase
MSAQGGAIDPDHGVVAVSRALRGLGSVKRVLIIGAHPDDEDTALLTVLERGLGADAAYLALNRGEGGQNLIGPELGVGLGLLRTEELMAARRLDGAEQFFTRAYDFGYSKSAEETFRLWPRDSLLADAVSVIRKFRPQVVVSIFSGTRRDGHGQHQAAGIIAREAFTAAGDGRRFPEQLSEGVEPWSPLKLYRSTRFDTASSTLTVETGALDLLYGRSYHQIAMASRSQHRSQDMGRVESLGPRRTSMQLVESRVDVGGEDDTSLFDGVDTTLIGMLPAIRDRDARGILAELLTTYDAHLRDSRSALGQGMSSDLVAHLSAALASVRQAVEAADRLGDEASFLRFTLQVDEAKLQRAVAEAAGVIVDAFANDDLVAPGQRLQIEVQVWNGGDRPVELESISIDTPAGWVIEPIDGPVAQVAPATLARLRFRMTLPDDARPSELYYLRTPLVGAVYNWPPEPDQRGLPRGKPVVEADVGVSIAGQSVRRRVEAVYRFADQARGEVRRPVLVVPAIGVSVAPAVGILPLGRESVLTFSVSLRSEASEPIDGRVYIELPESWASEPAELEFRNGTPGSSTTYDFIVRAPAMLAAGTYKLTAVAETSGGQRYASGYSVVDYEHVRRSLLFREATARVEALDVAVENDLRVAYVPGGADVVAAAIVSLGVSVELLDAVDIATGDLSRYDVVVLGIRAYETNPALVANSDRFLDWVRSGGTLIVQYQQYRFFRGDFAPYALSARRPHDRVTDETAPVRILDSGHPMFNVPNVIGKADFDSWIQERGLYFASEWDERYQPLLEMADPGEEPKRGGLLAARYGDGLYVYTGLSLFRQLPAGVPGAYRLLANLLSLR